MRKRLAIGITILLVLAALWWLPVSDWLGAVPEQAAEAGWVGVFGFGLVYALATVLLLPASVLTLGAGLAWGPLIGFAIVWPSATLGAVSAFALARTLFRERAEAFVSKDDRFQALDAAIAQDGALLVFLMRLSPVFPFSFLNVGLGVTAIPWLTYTVATAIGMIPGTFLYVYLGSVGQQLGSDQPSTPGQQAMFWTGLAATLLVTVVVTRTARRALHQRLDSNPTTPDAP